MTASTALPVRLFHNDLMRLTLGICVNAASKRDHVEDRGLSGEMIPPRCVFAL